MEMRGLVTMAREAGGFGGNLCVWRKDGDQRSRGVSTWPQPDWKITSCVQLQARGVEAAKITG